MDYQHRRYPNGFNLYPGKFIYEKFFIVLCKMSFSSIFDLSDAQDLGFEDSMIKYVVDGATSRMEDVAHKNKVLVRQDIDAIVQGVLHGSKNI